VDSLTDVQKALAIVPRSLVLCQSIQPNIGSSTASESETRIVVETGITLSVNETHTDPFTRVLVPLVAYILGVWVLIWHLEHSYGSVDKSTARI